LGTAISLKDVSFKYLHADEHAISHVNLEIEEGTVTAIIGETGAGKSTLLMTLNAIIPSIIPGYLDGEIIVAGQNLHEKETAEMARHINMVFDDPVLQIVSLTVEEDIAFGPANLNLPREEIWDRVRAAQSVTRLQGYEKRNPRTMSGGEQQLLAIAGVLAMRPKILVLDEPVAMLDPLGKAQVLSVVRELNSKYGTTVLIAESGTDIEAVCEFADQVVLMNQGHILAFGPVNSIYGMRHLIEEAKMKAPQVTRLLWGLNGADLPPKVPTTLVAAEEYLRAKLGPSLSASKVRRSSGPVPVAEPKAAKEPVIEIRNLHHVFSGNPPVHALNGIDLTINKGEMVALLGQNGSGKTTLSYHLVGVDKPTNKDATIRVDGIDVVHGPLSETVRHINYLFQNPANQLFCETFGQEVSFGPEKIGMSPQDAEQRARESLRAVGLEDLWDHYSFGISKAREALLSLASVLSLDPQIFIADEPTGGLDSAAAEKVMEILTDLNRKGRTIIVITHDMELAARYTSRVVVLRKGEVLMDGTPEEVFGQTDVLASTQLYPPQITRLAQRLMDYGMPPNVLSVEELYAKLLPLMPQSAKSAAL